MRATFSVAILAVFLVSQQVNAGFLDKVSNFLSGSSSSTVAPDSLLGKLQNSSFGQAVANGIETYNDYKNSSSGSGSSNLLSAAQNSSFGIAIANYLGGNNTINLGNSSFGDLVMNGINTFMNGNSTQGQMFLANHIPFLANASANATAAFTALLPQMSNLSVADYEVAMSNWAATWNLTDVYNAHVAQMENKTAQAESNASRIVLSLDLVLSNIKSIQNNKNQTMVQMINATANYMSTLDDDTRAIIFILYRSVLPPALQQAGTCAVSGGFSNLMQKAGNFFSGASSNGNSTATMFGLNANMFQNFFNRNNATIPDFSIGVQNALSDTADVEVAVVEVTTKKTKTTKKKTTKKQKTTTAAPSRK
ncbi:unnamed protein product [Caenorhabditis angaria]|uniref:SXP/RAL-2 family protein Ani s 5-like cation-binding domain-containing protein n=1 Tax=Caenorhabditis angaria TaxID=860376 RepID=A0A9P1N298_9PELO|nr:unnamed protein product [Caenorhabditis angaria]